jgi:hypothetical protein
MQSGATFDCWGSHLSASLFLPERVSVFLRERDGDGETGQECPGYGSGVFLALLDENLFAGWEPECLDRRTELICNLPILHFGRLTPTDL